MRVRRADGGVWGQPDGTAGKVNAGQKLQNSKNRLSVSQNDCTCFQLSQQWTSATGRFK